MIDNNFQDQTVFSANQPLYDQVASDPLLEQQEADLKPNKKRKVIIVSIVAFLLVIIALILLVLFSSNSSQIDNPTASVLPSPSANTNQEGDVVFDRLKQIKSDLDEAEPNDQTLPFPPVNMEINLEE